MTDKEVFYCLARNQLLQQPDTVTKYVTIGVEVGSNILPFLREGQQKPAVTSYEHRVVDFENFKVYLESDFELISILENYIPIIRIKKGNESEGL